MNGMAQIIVPAKASNDHDHDHNHHLEYKI